MAEVTPNGPGLVAPTYYPPRDFRTNASEQSGNILNPPSFLDMGGLTGPGKINPNQPAVQKPMDGKAPVTRKASRV